jgi:hypothetical protein
MSQENVELVRRGHEAFRDSGEEAIFEYRHADIDLTPIEELLDAETSPRSSIALSSALWSTAAAARFVRPEHRKEASG